MLEYTVALGLPTSELLQILHQNGKSLKRSGKLREIATGVAEKEGAKRVATFLSGIDENAVHVYNTSNWVT